MRFVGLILALIALVSCGNETLVNNTTAIVDGDWAYSDSRTISVDVSDTLTPYNFYVLVRHGGDYRYQNLIIYFKTYYPNNKYKVDTIDCPLANNAGKWFGSGLGDLLDNRIMFKRNVQLPQSGSYKFEIQHAMRPDTIHEIYDIGLMIESAYE